MGWNPQCCNVCSKGYLSYNSTSNSSQLVFGQNAMLNVKFEADWQLIKQRKQRIIYQNNQRENSKRIPYQYKVGDKVST